MRSISFAFLALALFAASCKECQKTQKNVIEPTKFVATILDTKPTGSDLARACAEITPVIRNLPEGAETIRTVARDKFLRSETPLPGYDEAIRLSRDLDEMFGLTNQMCTEAYAGHYDEAYGLSRAVGDILNGRILPMQADVYQLACTQ